jgi:tellurite resistance protein TerC
MPEMIWFTVYFACLLAMDYLWNRGDISLPRSLLMAGFYIAAALAYAASIYIHHGSAATSQFLTIFSLEQLLSVDNLLVISLIFAYFKIPENKQHTALLYGIIGAIGFRTVAIFTGVALIERLTWVLFGFAAFLIWSGWQIMQGDEDSFDPADKKLVQFHQTQVRCRFNFPRRYTRHRIFRHHVCR